jgi:hypothetical protein
MDSVNARSKGPSAPPLLGVNEKQEIGQYAHIQYSVLTEGRIFTRIARREHQATK